MKTDFLALRQGSTTVVEYERRFDELSHYAMQFISTEANRAKRFEQGLRPVIREKLVALKIRDYGDIVDRAGAGSSGVQWATHYHHIDQIVGPRPQIPRGAKGVPCNYSRSTCSPCYLVTT